MSTNPEAAKDGFAEWFVREMPAGTVISNPAWWASRIRRAVASADQAAMQPPSEKWIIAHESVIDGIPCYRPELGYTVFAQAIPPFDSFEEASAVIRELRMPLGWVAMKTTQGPWPGMFGAYVPAIEQAGPVAGNAEQRAALIDMVNEHHLTSVYRCTRVWSAWGAGTMSEEDFSPANASDIAAEIVDAILGALATGERSQPVDDLPALVKQLAHKLGQAAPGNDFSLLGVDYLRRIGSLGSPLRESAALDMRAICEALGFDPTNHHNAAKCPYCRPPEATPAQPLAAEAGERVYQIRGAFPEDLPHTWRDASEAAFDSHPAKDRRILYAAPPPQAKPPALVDIAARVEAMLTRQSWLPDGVAPEAVLLRDARAALAQPVTSESAEAARWREVARRFDGSKTSACERVLEGLRIDGDATAPLADIIDLVLQAGTEGSAP